MKICNHPMLCRNFYDDSKISTIAKKLKQYEEHYEDMKLRDIMDDLKESSDFVISEICRQSPFLKEMAVPTGESLLHK